MYNEESEITEENIYRVIFKHKEKIKNWKTVCPSNGFKDCLEQLKKFTGIEAKQVSSKSVGEVGGSLFIHSFLVFLLANFFRKK